MRRLLLKIQVALLGRCYSASIQAPDMNDFGFPLPVKSWAERSAARRTKRTGMAWEVTKWARP